MEYYQYFRLSGPPFQPASPRGPVYFSPNHLEGLATLEAGLTGELTGLTLLTGEAGTGKTTLIFSLLQRDYKRVRIANIDDPKLSFLEMMRVVLPQLKLYSSGSTKLDYLKVLDHLLELHGKEERIAIVVDESQLLSDDVLEELRLLSNRGQRNDRCLLQLILVGQPELAERLKKPELRQLNQRISSRGVLKPLNPEAAITYVDYRLRAEGGQCAAIFEPGALKHLLRRSDGIPRKINMLCHSAMLAAFYAGERKVSVRMAKKTAAEYQDSVGIKKRKSGARLLVMPALIAGTALASLLLVGAVYPNVWSEWLLSHTLSFGKATEQIVRPDSRAIGHRKASGIRREAKAATPLTPHSAESQASLAPGAAAPAAPKSDVAGPGTAAAMPIAPSTPAAAAASAGAQQPTGVPAAREQRSQITVTYGDTLENIAIRYFGSKSGINELVAANPRLTDINQLTAGQIIYLPHGVTPKASHDRTATGRLVPNTEDSSGQ
jgi:type II secretory pathway predicted ATPase ExeA/phage tail protein X